MANKKTFDREKMYRKIMPTYYDNNFALATDTESNLPNFDFDDSHTAYEENRKRMAMDTSDDFDEDFHDSSFDKVATPRNTVVSFPTAHSVGTDTEDIKSSIKQAVKATVTNLTQADEDIEVKEKSTPMPAYGSYGEPVQGKASFRKTSGLEKLREEHKKAEMYNLTEKVIREKLDVVMENMNCCRCDRCKMDVIALTLNNMEPYYVVRTEENEADCLKAEKELAEKATSEVLKAVLKVRKNPRH